MIFIKCIQIVNYSFACVTRVYDKSYEFPTFMETRVCSIEQCAIEIVQVCIGNVFNE